jgi:hypothetical protein
MHPHMVYFFYRHSRLPETKTQNIPGAKMNSPKTEIINFNFEFPCIAETHNVFPRPVTVGSSDGKIRLAKQFSVTAAFLLELFFLLILEAKMACK